MAEKVVNYSESMVDRLHAVYDGEADEAIRDQQVAQLAEELGKSPASIRAKLTREGIYVPKAKAPAGKATIRKADLVSVIAEKLDVNVEVVESLEKATKATLVRVASAL